MSKEKELLAAFEVLKKEAREWRDKELLDTDYIASIVDHSLYSNIMWYRANLRNWPSTDDFPLTKPIM